ncbi:MAG: thiamine phosphate synthase [Methylococcaceae bacterium]|nr:thiamine phosphate synthase [Methylococcaceae bacterium]
MKFPNRGLYAITQAKGKVPATVIAEVDAAIRGGAAVVQYRDKNPVDPLYLARELVKVCHHHKIPLLVNDDLELAIQSGADGVHLGKDDGHIAEARARLGAEAIIGISCYNSLDRALEAQAHGATYAAFGRFFPSGTKPLAAPAHLDTLRQAKAALSIPIVAIGGILPENGADLLAAGADLLAVIGGIFEREPEASARTYLRLFEQ